MAWIYLIIASFGEIFGVISINYYVRYRTFLWLCAMVVSFFFGFYFLALAMQHIALGTAYAVWTGLGAAGAVLIGIFFFNEGASWKRILFLFFIIGGAVGLRIME